MVLVDSSVWIDHIRKPDAELIDLLTGNHVLMHPFVIGEILLGSVANRLELAATLDGLRKIRPATIQDVRVLIESARLYGRGIGLADANLVTSCLLTPGTQLLTRDKRLKEVAIELGLGLGA